MPGDSFEVLVRDGTGYAVRKLTGEEHTFDPVEQGAFIPLYATLAFKSSSGADGRTTDVYTCKTLDGGVGEVRFVFEKGKLIEMTTPELTVAGTWPVSDFSADPPDALFALAPETIEVLWTNGNTDAVKNGAKDYYVKFALPACTVTEIETYHSKSGGKQASCPQVEVVCWTAK